MLHDPLAPMSQWLTRSLATPLQKLCDALEKSLKVDSSMKHTLVLLCVSSPRREPMRVRHHRLVDAAG